MLVLAHRGYSSRAPENTLAAFRMALDVQADGLELDVQLTKDGEVVVIHDHTLERTTDGEGFVQAYTLAELQKLDAGSWFGAEFRGEILPSFRQVCRLVQDKDILLNVELKVALGFEELVDKIGALLDEYGLLEKSIVSSFNHYALAYLKQRRPEIKTGILYMAGLYNPWVYAKSIGANALHPFYQGVIPDVVAGAQSQGLQVNAFTVNAPNDIKNMIGAGVDGIITDVPELVQSMLV